MQKPFKILYIYLIEYFSKLLKCFPGTSNDTGNAYDIQLNETGQIYNLIQNDINYTESLHNMDGNIPGQREIYINDSFH